MKRLGSVTLISVLASAALFGCENNSRLDKTVQSADPKAEKADVAPVKTDHSGSLEDRVARLEDHYAKSAESMEWLAKWYEQQKSQQKAQQAQQAREDPDPDAVFAVNIAPDIKLGQVEGSPQALVTIVEAWDFA
ncbi:MAG TPA: hypothetical protein VGD37_01725 [Kofleriaceae bacterium]|jgi:hypothetical protein